MTKQEQFVNQIAPYITKEAAKRGYKFAGMIIAQAALESAWGKSKLAAEYHNYFGLKCGRSWTGRSVNMSTKEEYTAGTLTTIKDNFRAYYTMEDGVKGYFDFISAKRYAAAKNAVSAEHFISLIWVAGFATSKRYVENVVTVYKNYNLKWYDSLVCENSTPSVSAYEPETDPELEQAIQVIAEQVIRGKFGTGHDHRAQEIYKLIRAKVNELC